MDKDDLFIEANENLNINTNNLEDISVNKVLVDTKLSKEINKIKGEYITISYKDDIKVDKLIDVVKSNISELLSNIGYKKNNKILLIGLGAKDESSDSFGYKVIEKIVVSNNMYKIYKNTYYDTNIDSYTFIKNLSDTLNIDYIIIFDSLRTNDINKLGKTIQITNAGVKSNSISKEISKRTLKKNIITIGIPTIVNLKDIRSDNLLITANNISEITNNVSSIISIVINRIM